MQGKTLFDDKNNFSEIKIFLSVHGNKISRLLTGNLIIKSNLFFESPSAVALFLMQDKPTFDIYKTGIFELHIFLFYTQSWFWELIG